MNYLTDLIGDEYRKWGNRKILISAPTGMGKTTFIVKILLPYLHSQGRKLLILCNRKLLRQQYWFDLISQYTDYTELEESVQLMTYQELALKFKNRYSVIDMFSDFQTIVCDEAHYFYADADFNAFGTFALLQLIVYAGMSKQIIFLSATMHEVKKIITPLISNCWEVFRRQHLMISMNVTDTSKEIVNLDFSILENYARFECIAVPDESALCAFLEKSQDKSVVFIDSKERAFKMQEKLIRNGKVNGQKVSVLNADNIDDSTNDELVRQLTINHKLVPKILITTSVLDNGVSLHDPEIGNLVIVTESRISFLQMLGRVRAETVKKCKLVFLKRNADVFMRRMNNYKQKLDQYKKLEHMDLTKHHQHFANVFWENNDELADFYRIAIVKFPFQYQCYTLSKQFSFGCVLGDEKIFLNHFAMLKTANMYMTESRFYKKAINDPLDVIYEQMSWIGKDACELWLEDSPYLEERKQQFIADLLSVQNFSNTDLQDFKARLVSIYHRDFFSDILAKNGTLSLEKLKVICERMGLTLDENTDPEKRTKLYSIQKTTNNS